MAGVLNLLIFDGGRGIKATSLNKILEIDLEIILDTLKGFLDRLGIDLCHVDNHLFLKPKKDMYLLLEEFGMLNWQRFSRNL